MRLSVNYYSDRLLCPSCGVSLCIETTYEDRLIDCEGIEECPECGCELEISASVKFEIKEISV